MSGKSSALQRLATEVWVHKDGKSCFDRIYVFSASVGKTFEDGIDDTWQPVKRLIETQLIDRTNPNHNAETFFYDELDGQAMQALSDIVDLQFSMIELSRKHGRKKEPQILIFRDDVSDQPRWTKSPILTKLYTRGRHANITTVASLHRARGILQPVVRSQLTGILFFRQRSALELQAFLAEKRGHSVRPSGHGAHLSNRDGASV